MPDYYEMGTRDDGFDIELESALGLAGHLNEDHPFGKVAETFGGAQQDQPGLAIDDRSLPLPDHDRFGTGAADPAVNLTVGGEDGAAHLDT